MQRKALGRGLEALFPGLGPTPGEQVVKLGLDAIRPNRYQPRRRVDEGRLAELAASIREHGVVQPVVVRPLDGGYELVAGERRWRAARLAGLEDVPAVVRDVSDRELLQVALIENLQREDLNPIEEACAYRTLMQEFGMTQEEVAQKVARSRPQVANMLRLLNLDAEVQGLLLEGKLGAGHGKVLLAVESPAWQRQLARRIADGGLTVRQAEALVAGAARGKAEGGGGPSTAHRGGKDPALARREEELRQQLDTRVAIRPRGKGGVIEIAFRDDAELQRLVAAILGRASPARPLAAV
ncbi:MAG: ParB/RepB/Spo0J family partition protein [Acetobacteraceae bacterium]|nr:ParB/RepB/Spo0J family partition protein [Acetobacteraceae bacterium]